MWRMADGWIKSPFHFEQRAIHDAFSEYARSSVIYGYGVLIVLKPVFEKMMLFVVVQNVLILVQFSNASSFFYSRTRSFAKNELLEKSSIKNELFRKKFNQK